LNKYIKWELKAFVAYVIKASESNAKEPAFTKTMRNYMMIKGLKLDESLIKTIYKEINDY